MSLTSAVVEDDPIAAASAVALRHTSDDVPGIARQAHGQAHDKAFRHATAAGKPVRDTSTLSRIRALAIPPAILLAWTEVWICTLTEPRERRRA
ncbi:MAG: hypothetical protein H0T89_16100 [Deltaproteobacteria bacterium]|nr:hypothetical protein [Deltaproteobacteria bacterium]MDQ3300992.1 hypothetical protein [Myxococcota bacterium]